MLPQAFPRTVLAALFPLVVLIPVTGWFLAPLTPAAAQLPSPPAPSAPSPTTQTPTPSQPPAPPQHPGQQPTRNPDGTYTVRSTARIVILDTVVLDSSGNVVKNLTRNDFHITEDGTPQNLIGFEAAGAHPIPPDASINSTQDLDREAPRSPVNIILLDEFNTHFEDMAFARYSLKKYFEKQPAKLSMPTMLIAVSLRNFTVLRDYTQDKNAILDALNHHFAAYPWQAHGYSWMAERYSTAFGTLLRIADATAGHQGHKNMIWIGRGFPNLNLSRVPLDARDRVESVVQECVNKLRDARITLYTIDPAGLQVDSSTYGSDAALWDPFGGSYEFNKLATATGGRTFYGRNDVDAEIGTSLRDGASFYTLVYRPTNSSRDPRKFRRIQISFDHPGYHAVTREGYYLERGPYRVDAEHPPNRLAFDLNAANSSNMTYDGVPITALRNPANPDAFTVHIDARALNWSPATDTEPRLLQLAFLAAAFDKKGGELQRIAKNITVTASGGVPPTGRFERSVDIKIAFSHNPKAVRARFIVRLAATGRIGSADAPLGGSPPPPSGTSPNTQPTPQPAPQPDTQSNSDTRSTPGAPPAARKTAPPSTPSPETPQDSPAEPATPNEPSPPQ